MQPQAPSKPFVPTGLQAPDSGLAGPIRGLATGRLGIGSLIFFCVSASAPMTVLAGGVVATFATTGSIGVPLSFLVLGFGLIFFAISYAAMSRHVVNAGVFYAYIAKGLGGAAGVGASWVAIVAYNAIQIGLYGLFGAVTSGFFATMWGWDISWQVCAIGVWLIIGILGLLRVDVTAKVLAVSLLAEVLAVLVFDLGAFTHPAGGHISAAGFNPQNLFTTGLGGVLAFGIAAFTGIESAGDYAEEARDPRRTVGRALVISVILTTVLYSVSAWGLTVAVGPDKIVDAARDPASGIPFSIIDAHFGSVVADLANLLLITSVFAAMLSFHNTSNRYMFSAGRERVLPSIFGYTSPRKNAIVAGSLFQSALAIVVLIVFMASHKDPITELFTWLSYVAAVAVVLLMFGSSLAALLYLNRRSQGETTLQRVVAPVLAILVLGTIAYIVAANADALLGAEKGSTLTYVLPGIVGAALVLGVVWGLILRQTRPRVYDGIGTGGPAEA